MKFGAITFGKLEEFHTLKFELKSGKASRTPKNSGEYLQQIRKRKLRGGSVLKRMGSTHNNTIKVKANSQSKITNTPKSIGSLRLSHSVRKVAKKKRRPYSSQDRRIMKPKRFLREGSAMKVEDELRKE